MIGNGKSLETELEFLVESIRTMRELRETRGFAAADTFQKKMEEYFRLGIDMRNTFVYDELLRLADTPAGTLGQRDVQFLKEIHALVPGSRFTLDGSICYLERHMRLDKSNLRDGFFEYTPAGETRMKPMEYNRAWDLACEGRFIIG
jgi:hypothetical protein